MNIFPIALKEIDQYRCLLDRLVSTSRFVPGLRQIWTMLTFSVWPPNNLKFHSFKVKAWPISVLSSCQHQVSTICQAIHWMPTGNDWLALQGWHTVLLTPSQEREAVFQEKCHKPRWCWRDAVDLALRLNTQGHSPLLMDPAGHTRGPAQAMHLVQRSRINCLECQLHPRC